MDAVLWALLWYIWVSLAGWLVFPLLWRLVPTLPSRGWPYRRTFALMLWGYLYWLPTVLGWTPHHNATALAALAGLAVLGLATLRIRVRGHRVWAWMQANKAPLLLTEGVFVLGFLAWLVVRAANPEILGTEKPMELAFINAILRSPGLPPADPWLSGYSISYYYLGYLLVAMLARLSGTPGSVAFNLALALVFALTVETAAGLMWDMRGKVKGTTTSLPSLLLGPLFVVGIGNWEGVLEVLHRRGLFWTQIRGTWTSWFWSWTQIEALTHPPAGPPRWVPDRFWWWWQASRVVRDFTLDGRGIEIIDEFPFFSFLLGDLHPHVLSIPFVLTWFALMYALFLGAFRGRWAGWSAPGFAVLAVFLGGLAFLNAWDFPMSGLFLLIVLGVRFWQKPSRFPLAALNGFARGLPLLAAALFAYLPYHLAFSSQVKGILPNLISPTRGFHLWVMFGPLFVPLFLALGKHWRALAPGPAARKAGFGIALGLWTGLFVGSWVLAGILWHIAPNAAVVALDALGAASPAQLFRGALLRHVTYLAGALTLVTLLVLAWTVALGTRWGASRTSRVRAFPFPALMTAWAAVLVLIPNHLYVWDAFGTRMNTVFKLYYQAWLLWAVAAAAWSPDLLRQGHLLTRGVWSLALAMALVYPALSLPNRTQNFHPAQGWTLDGAAHMQRQYPDEWAAMRFLQEAPWGVVAEAVGGSYTMYGRMATFSGLPTVLGWPGHEIQWRGTADPLGSRETDIARLYTTQAWPEAQRILETYAVRYVVVGVWEREKYSATETFFREHLPVVFSSGTVTIFGYTPGQRP